MQLSPDEWRQVSEAALQYAAQDVMRRTEAAVERRRTQKLIRSSDEEKRAQVTNVEAFRSVRNLAPAAARERAEGSLAELQQRARDQGNVFASLMEATKSYSLGQISHALYAVGGEYRRNM